MNTQNNGRREEGREGGRKKAVGSEAVSLPGLDSFRAVSSRCFNLVRLYLWLILLKLYFSTFLL